MSTKERLLRLVQTETPQRPVPPRRVASRRAVHRVKTGAMDLTARLRVGVVIVSGRLADVSVAGCCIHVTVPLPHTLDAGMPVSVTLYTDEHTFICQAEVVAVADNVTNGDVRLHFRALPPQTYRALAAWVNTLARRDFQRRHSKDC